MCKLTKLLALAPNSASVQVSCLLVAQFDNTPKRDTFFTMLYFLPILGKVVFYLYFCDSSWRNALGEYLHLF
jgi:hypothetical protein